MLRNLPSGSYHIDPRPPAPGWYLRSLSTSAAQTVAAKNLSLALARDGIILRPGEHGPALTVTFTEGAANLRGRVSAPEGQTLPPRIRVYFVPAERENTNDVFHYFELTADADGRFVMGNITPGRYWIVARPAEQIDSFRVKLIRQDSDFRAKVLREAESGKKDISLKPCERIVDYDLPYAPASPAKQ